MQTPPPNPSGSFRVTDEGDGVVRVQAEAGVVRKEFAQQLCGAIEKASKAQNEPATLLIDIGALAKATPPAGLYAMKRIKQLGFERIALVGGNRFIRGFARTVMTLARFGSFRFFDRTEQGRDWLRRKSS